MPERSPELAKIRSTQCLVGVALDVEALIASWGLGIATSVVILQKNDHLKIMLHLGF